MHIIIVDRARNVRIAPTKAVTGESDPFSVLRNLIRGHPVENGQVVFECDQEFFDALANHPSEADFVPADRSQRQEPVGPNMSLVPVPTFGGAPILVQGEP